MANTSTAFDTAGFFLKDCMTDTKQPEALRMARQLSDLAEQDQSEWPDNMNWTILAVSAEMISQDARIAELEAENSTLKEQHEAIGAGGVTGLPDAQPFRSITWPKGREAGRMGDMTPLGESHMRVGFDSDNDVYVSVFNQACGAGDIEFCTYGQGGGKSPRTREALIALMVAMEEDSKETPSFRFPPGAAIAQEGGK